MGIFSGRNRSKRFPRLGETVSVDVLQQANRARIEGLGISLDFSVEGVTLPSGIDASFAVFALLPMAMEEGFNVQFNQPIDPGVAANAESLSQVWEMWLPGRYRTISIAGRGTWSRAPRSRLPLLHLFSGGIDSTFALIEARGPERERVALTVCGIDKTSDKNFDKLVAKTDPVLDQFGYRRVVVKTNAKRQPSGITHGLTLTSCLFLLSDLFEEGILAGDRSPAGDMVHFPWGSSFAINDYFAGSNFKVKTVGAVGRTEKVAAMVAAGVDFRAVSICRDSEIIPENCGRCGKCIRTKAEFLASTGRIPEIFLDASIDERMLRQLLEQDSERYHFFDFYYWAKKHGTIGKMPNLEHLVEEWRSLIVPPPRRRKAD